MIILTLVVLLVATLVVGVPIAFAMGIVAVAGLGLSGLGSAYVVAQRLFSGMNSYPLLALALFILAGNILVEGKVITHLVRFVDLLVGRMRGGLAQANVLANMLMAGVSGSATADAAALGSIMLPMMREKGYKPEFSAALTISAAVMGPIIPPSLVMVIYAIPSKLSVGALFLGGVLPGLMIGLSLMALAYVMCRRQQGLVALERVPWSETGGIVLRALPVMVGPVIVVGGILGGVFTATESAAVLVVYALLLTMGLYRTIGLSQLYRVLIESAQTTGIVMLMVATSSIFAWFLAIEDIPTLTSKLFASLSADRYVFLAIINVFLLVVGCFLDTVPAILIFVPILGPVAASFGVDPIHFALIVVVNLLIGINTPPVGSSLFVIAAIARLPMSRLSIALLPFYAVQILVLLAVTYLPETVLWLPRAAGLH
jgi:tripartite ATP-independent transporter DctM subunit